MRMSIARKVKRAGGGQDQAEAGDGFHSRRRVHHGLGRPLCRGEAGSSRQGRRLLDRHDSGDECRSSAASSGRPATSPSPRSRPTRRIIPARCRICCAPARSSSSSRRVRSISPTGRIGGPSPSAPTGGILMVRGARSRGSTIIPSCMSPIATPRPTRNGPARSCRARRNGSSPRAAA